jgi:predicted lipoprotein with Yx(FWY)xxD motif
MSVLTRRSLPLALAAAAVLIAIAGAGSASGVTTLTLRSVHSSALNGNVVATPTGRTLYRRKGETASHILCSKACATLWPPLTVASRSVRIVKGAGVRGTVGIIKRPDGRLQVTLSGHPLYRYSLDRRTGDAKGNGVGGIWFAMRASAPTPTTTSPPPTTTYPSY